MTCGWSHVQTANWPASFYGITFNRTQNFLLQAAGPVDCPPACPLPARPAEEGERWSAQWSGGGQCCGGQGARAQARWRGRTQPSSRALGPSLLVAERLAHARHQIRGILQDVAVTIRGLA